jgi:predicted DNA-binding antitoxin AbrB/MazE fold protein
MTKAIPAIYENGVLRPLAPVNFSERQTIWLQVFAEQTTASSVLFHQLHLGQNRCISIEENRRR